MTSEEISPVHGLTTYHVITEVKLGAKSTQFTVEFRFSWV